MNIILHSTDCPKCKILEQKLQYKNIDFEKNTDIDIKGMRSRGIMSAPILQVGDHYMEFHTAVEWVNNQ